MYSRIRKRREVITTLIIFVLDRLIKVFFLFFYPQKIIINSGLGFGIWPEYGQRWVLINVMVLISSLIYFIKKKSRQKVLFGLFWGALISNLFDRIYYSGVIDVELVSFLPANNLADYVLILVMGVLIYDKIRKS